ncbi:MAG: AsmA-like C-terminal domain-containing protein [Thermodesulfobacteriota bacterium]
MSRYKKISLWILGGAGALLVLLLLFILLLPTLINFEPMRKKILATVSQKVGGEVEFQGLDLSFFPRPRVSMHHGTLSIAGEVSGTLESLTMYPEILPLFTGKVQIAMLHVEAPDFKMKIPERPGKDRGELKAFSFSTIEDRVGSALALIASKARGKVVLVEKGTLNFSEQTKPVFWFQDIRARIDLTPNRLKIDVTCKSNLWKSISLKGWLNAKDFKGNGRIGLTHFQPQALADYLFPLANQRVSDSKVNLDLSFKADGPKTFQAEVVGSIPYMTLYQADNKLVIKGKSLRGTLHVDGNRATGSLTELNLDYPQLTMSGKFLIDQASPRVSLELKGRDVDVYSTREVALALMGKSRITRKIFDIVKGGKVPLISLNTQASSVGDLGKAENILIKSSLLKGNIFIPEVRFPLEDVKGEVVISQGILEGKNLEGRLGNSRGREGVLRLGLKGNDAPFHLETVIQADLAQLPPILKRLVKDENFREETALVKDVKGNALGRLVLGETTESIKVNVDVWDFKLHSHYQRIPFPVEINGGGFSYDGTKIALKNLRGKLGKSSFSGLSTRLDYKKDFSLEIMSGASRISMDEVYPWLLSFERLRDALKNSKSVKGTVIVKASNLKGPLFRPKKWRFRMTGELEDLAIDSSLFPGPMAVTKGTFEAIPERLALKDSLTNISDASLRVSGSLGGYLEGLHTLDLALEGSMGSEASQWVSDLVRMPPELRIRTPLSISKAHLFWDKNAKTLFSGNLAVKDGPEVSIDIVLNPQELTIKNLLIQDEESRASLTFNLKKREFDLSFSGNLNKKTTDQLLAENQFLAGWIKGDFRAHISVDQPMRSTAQGKLHAANLGSLGKLKVPVRIESVSLNATKNRLKVESAICTWKDSRLMFEGNVDFSANGFLLDMDLSADALKWGNIKEILAKEKEEKDREQGEKLLTLPLQGILRVKSKYFMYGEFTWNPFYADISFSNDGVSVSVTEADLCGISTPGIIQVSPQGLLLDVKPVSKNQELDPTLACLWDKKGLMSGNFNLGGNLVARGKYEELAQSLRGNVEFLANNGRIYRFGVLAKIFALLNVTEIFMGKLPDLGKEGFAYDSVKATGNLHDGKLTVKEGILDGPSMKIVWQGNIDLTTKKMDLTVLVAPLKTADRIIGKIPWVGEILGGTLISIPIGVTGDIRDPTVMPLSPSAVGSEIVGIMKRILRLPIKFIPLTPK